MNRKEYSEDWQDTIRPAILKRDNYRCKECGVTHRSRVYKNKSGSYMECDEFTEAWAVSNGHKVFTLYLQVAHLNHNKLDNRPENLLTLCPAHHARFDNAHKKQLRKTLLAEKVKVKSRSYEEYLNQKSLFLAGLREAFRELTGTRLSSADLESIYLFISKNFKHE